MPSPCSALFMQPHQPLPDLQPNPSQKETERLCQSTLKKAALGLRVDPFGLLTDHWSGQASGADTESVSILFVLETSESFKSIWLQINKLNEALISLIPKKVGEKTVGLSAPVSNGFDCRRINCKDVKRLSPIGDNAMLQLNTTLFT